jgi:hypothetical protein
MNERNQSESQLGDNILPSANLRDNMNSSFRAPAGRENPNDAFSA